jgi:prophage DNA circulation protein
MAAAKINQTLDIREEIYAQFSSNEHIKIAKANILKTCFNDVLTKLCFALDSENIILDYRYFKFIASAENYELIICYIVSVIQNVLSKHETFILHVNLDSLSLLHIEKHFGFIKRMSEVLKTTFPDKLNTCNVYNAPFIFSKIISITSVFVDKKTQQKIKLVKSE